MLSYKGGWAPCSYNIYRVLLLRRKGKLGYWGKKIVSATNAIVEKCGHVN